MPVQNADKKNIMLIETHVQVADIPEEGLFLNFEELAGLIGDLDEFSSVSHASGRLELHKSGAEVQISGWVRGKMNLSCDRCLASFAFPVDASFFYLLKPSKEFHREIEPDHEVTGDEIHVYWYEDGLIRAEELFREQILLQLPMRVLCREDCRGLCAGCGADLNREECRCQEVVNHGPFSALAGLKTIQN